MFSQGATLEECQKASELYHSLAGFYPEAVVMRIFSVAPTHEEARERALPATDYFIKCMRAVKASKEQPKFYQENYDELLKQRTEFFDAKNFMQAGIIGTPQECVEQIKLLKNAVPNLHLVLKAAALDIEVSKQMLSVFTQEIKHHI
jgi:alkanesulfonate monooxygenase SsuD/methylene tetrahydromethanopterin reductase-like flavin-dependent oxidoreductase (luciferase family)